jgi:hypothetical protein
MSLQTRVSHLIYNLLPTDISRKTWPSSPCLKAFPIENVSA